MIPPDLLFWLIATWLFMLGASIGSFLNVCVHRFPKHERLKDQLRGIVSPPSHCPKCEAKILTRDNIPVLGWILLKGRCRNCQLKISWRYPLIELLNGLLFVAVYWLEVPEEFRTRAFDSSAFCQIGPQISHGFTDGVWLHWRYAFHMLMIEALLVASLIDLDSMSIPDGSTVPAMLLALAASVCLGQLWLVPVWYEEPWVVSQYAPGFAEAIFGPLRAPPVLLLGSENAALSFNARLEVPAWVMTHPHWHGLLVSVVGLVVGGGTVWLIRLVGYWALRQEAMGFGDVILMAMVGAFVGWQPVLIAIVLSAFYALLVYAVRMLSQQQSYIPFGPYLSLGSLTVAVFWSQIWPMFGRIFAAGVIVPAGVLTCLLMMYPALLFTQLIKKMLGIPLAPPPFDPELQWTSADTLTYLACETVERDRQSWKREGEWEGAASGHGGQYENDWRDA